MRSLLIAASATLLGGCLPSAFDGTWLFFIDYEPGGISGDCEADPDDTYVIEYDGTSNLLVDMYSTSNKGLVVLFEQALYGDYDSKSFSVENEEEVITSSEDYATREIDRWEMQADLEGGVLSGEFVEYQSEEDNDGYSYTCEVTYDFNAERVTSPQSRYPED